MKKVFLTVSVIVLIVASSCLLFACSNNDNSWSWYQKEHEHYYLKRTYLPTCTEQGYDYRYCADCVSSYTENYTEPLSVGGHEFDGYVCNRCKALDPSAPMTEPDCLDFEPIYAENSKDNIIGYEVIGLAEPSLKYLKIQSTYKNVPVIRIRKEAFIGCSNLAYVELSEGIEAIGEEAFKWCSEIKTVILPNSLRFIEHYAFLDCLSLENFVLNEGLQSIGYCAFRNCSALRTIVIPDSVTNIDSYAFMRCQGLEEVYIGSGMSCIGQYTFDGCENLKKVKMPVSVKEIYWAVFNNCSSLETIVYEGTIEQWINSVFRHNGGDNCIDWDNGAGDFDLVCKNATIHYSNR